jgi:2-oxoglutarate dehydrogenase complex dehydrogenase (E1) component-like enzyme
VTYIINYCFQLKYCGREIMAAPAVGDGYLHQREANEVIIKPFTNG